MQSSTTKPYGCCNNFVRYSCAFGSFDCPSQKTACFRARKSGSFSTWARRSPTTCFPPFNAIQNCAAFVPAETDPRASSELIPRLAGTSDRTSILRSLSPLMLKRSNLRLRHLSEGWLGHFNFAETEHFYGSGAHLVILPKRSSEA